MTKPANSSWRWALVAVSSLLLAAAGCGSTSSKPAVKVHATTTTIAPRTSTTIPNGLGPPTYAMPTGPDAQVLTSACSGLGSFQAIFDAVAGEHSVAPLVNASNSQNPSLGSLQELATGTSSPQIAQVRQDAALFLWAWQVDEKTPESAPAGTTGPAVGLAMIRGTMLAWSNLSGDCGSFNLTTG